MSKHTPGPWFVQPWFLTVYSLSNGTSGLTCAITSVLKDQSGRKQAEANARLIAAAPDLLEALEYLEDAASCLTATFGYIREDYPERNGIHTHEGHTETYLGEMLEKARTAIAKVKGTTP